jgi:hypothetical protein
MSVVSLVFAAAAASGTCVAVAEVTGAASAPSAPSAPSIASRARFLGGITAAARTGSQTAALLSLKGGKASGGGGSLYRARPSCLGRRPKSELPRGLPVQRSSLQCSDSGTVFFFGVSCHFVPLTVKVADLSPLLPIWPLDRLPDCHLGSVWGQSCHLGSAGSTMLPICPAAMHCCHYAPQRCRRSVVAGVLRGTHCCAEDPSDRHRKPDDTSYDPHNQKFSPSQPEAEFFTIGDPECCQPPPLHLQSPQDSLVRALQETCQPRGV